MDHIGLYVEIWDEKQGKTDSQMESGLGGKIRAEHMECTKGCRWDPDTGIYTYEYECQCQCRALIWIWVVDV